VLRQEPRDCARAARHVERAVPRPYASGLDEIRRPSDEDGWHHMLLIDLCGRACDLQTGSHGESLRVVRSACETQVTCVNRFTHFA
jgi:hypothetical protein